MPIYYIYFIYFIYQKTTNRVNTAFLYFRVFQKIEIILYNGINNKYVSITGKYIINLYARSKAPAGLQKFKKAAATIPQEGQKAGRVGFHKGKRAGHTEDFRNGQFFCHFFYFSPFSGLHKKTSAFFCENRIFFSAQKSYIKGWGVSNLNTFGVNFLW